MAVKEKHWEDDDGRTIADMSQVKRPSLFGNLPGSVYKREEKPEEQEPRKAAPWVDDSLSKQDRHAFFLGHHEGIAADRRGLPGGIWRLYSDPDASVPLRTGTKMPERASSKGRTPFFALLQ